MKVGLALMLLVMAPGCGRLSETRDEAGWLPITAVDGLPTGQRALAYDGVNDVLWLLTRPIGGEYSVTDPSVGAILTRYDPIEDTAQSWDVPGGSPGSVLAGLQVSHGGILWFTLGNRLISFRPAGEEFQSWTLPPFARSEFLPDLDRTELDGTPIDLSVSREGHIVVARVHSASLDQFNPTTQSWSAIAVEGWIGLGRGHTLVATPSGLLVARISQGAESVVEVGSGPAAKPVAVRRPFASLSSKAVAFVDSAGGIASYDTTLGTVTPSSARPPGAATSHHLTTGPANSVWTWDDRAAAVVRTTQGAATSDSFAYPTVTVNNTGSSLTNRGPATRRVLPSVQGVVVDRRGDAWVAVFEARILPGNSRGYSTGWKGYPALSRLRPSA